ncbi:MAG: exodeoxyribonuclease VII large subunit [Chloroflexi bacterium]|nr:exodeoxyribonuclease VII large subunit [Chloroflexota bacterium]
MVSTAAQALFLASLYERVESVGLVLEVSQLTSYLGSLFGSDPVLHDVWLRGEVTNVSRAASGHYYFCLRDASAQFSAVLFRGSAARSPALPQAGQCLVAHGRVELYERQGRVQLIVDMLFPEGMGLAQMQSEALLRRLEAEGLFDTGRKRPLPALPRHVGLVTSPAGAALHDVLTVLERRFPLARVVFAPALVQGDGAPASIVRALRQVAGWTEPGTGRSVDVVIVGRGGGSAEDLAAFNDEGVARAIFGSRVPVVSAVGHETDTTVADLVADVRAPTPSAAAELVAPDIQVLRHDVAALCDRASRAVRDHTRDARHRQVVLAQKMDQAIRAQLGAARQSLETRVLQMAAMSPLSTLERGYAIVERASGAVADDAGELQPGEWLRIRLRRGEAETTVTAARPA